MTWQVKLLDGGLFVESGERNGVGYARLFTQLLASAWGLDEVWMLDDNITSTWLVEIEDILHVAGQVRARPIEAQPCGFSTLMLGVESLLDKKDDWSKRLRVDGTQPGEGGIDREEVHFSSWRKEEAVNFDAYDAVKALGSKAKPLPTNRESCFLALNPKDLNPKDQVRVSRKPTCF